jgi:hypothetical protein
MRTFTKEKAEGINPDSFSRAKKGAKSYSYLKTIKTVLFNKICYAFHRFLQKNMNKTTLKCFF